MSTSNSAYKFILASIKNIFNRLGIETRYDTKIIQDLATIILKYAQNVENKEDHIANALKKLEKLPPYSSIQAVFYRDGEIVITCFKKDPVDNSFGKPYLFTIKY